MLKFRKRTAGQPDSRTDTADGQTPDRTRTVSGAPRWVGWFTDVGRPLSAVVVMILCAPGERHLAELAGWGPRLSWGMAGLLVMYAGIAAVVATVRPKGAPGKRTAVLGAIVSLLLAMAAQPVSHYFVTGWMIADPRPPFWLVTVVSCVPPFVMGHLLHLAADPGNPPETAQNGVQDGPAAHECTRFRDKAPQLLTDYEADAEGYPHGTSVVNTVCSDCGSDVSTRVVAPPEQGDADDADDIPWSGAATWNAADADSVDPDMSEVEPPLTRPVAGQRVSAEDIRQYAAAQGWGPAGQPDNFTTPARPLFGPLSAVPDRTLSDFRTAGQGIVSAVRTDGLPDSGRTDNGHRTAGQGETPDSVRALKDGIMRLADSGQPDGQADMRTFITDAWSLNPDMSKADMRSAVRRSFPDKNADAVRKAVTRAEEAMRS